MNNKSRFLHLLLFLFLPLVSPAQVPLDAGTAAPAPLPDFTYVQFVNAATPPSISIKLNGREMYPDFRPGEKTTPGALPVLDGTIEVTDKTSGRSIAQKFKLARNASHSIVIVGDFQPIPVEKEKTEDPETSKGEKKRPNAAVYFLDHSMAGDETRLRYRLLNGVVGQPVNWADSSGQILACEPGKTAVFSGKKEKESMTVEVGRDKIPIRIHQDTPFRNLTFVVFLKAGKPTFATIPEDVRETE